MLKIHELTTDTGTLEGVFLRVATEGAALELVEPDGTWPLPLEALEKVMARYGAPFDPQAEIAVVGELELGGGRRLRQVRHLAGYDVIARDYLVLDPAAGESHCALATHVAGALQFLARAARRAMVRE
jgi:hypothetical protein